MHHGQSSQEWVGIEKRYYAQTVRRQPIVLVRGQGSGGVAEWCETQRRPVYASAEHFGRRDR